MAEYFEYDDEWNEAIGEEIDAFLSSPIQDETSPATGQLRASEGQSKRLSEGLVNLGLLK